MLASIALAEKAPSQEGRRVLRNAATIGAFLASPLHLFLMVRALGAAGYGRWWWTFVLLEAANLLGVLGTDLYVRREIPPCADDPEGNRRVAAIVGTSLAIVCVLGVGFALLQIALATTLAGAQGDPELRPFLVLLAFQPVMWSVGAVLGAALQSRHHLGGLAALRGIIVPAIVALVFYVAWRADLPAPVTLAMMLCASLLALLLTVGLYARYFSLRAVLRAMLRPTLVRPALANGFRLVIPLALYTVGGKLDLYVVGAYHEPAYVGIYAACLQVSALVPNVRGLFDPIAQTQIGASYAADRKALGSSLRYLARLCAFAIAPAFVLTVAVGQPVLGWLVGGPQPGTFEPLVVLAMGHLVTGIALAAWIVPMMFAGRTLALIAATAGLVKFGLLLLLVPHYGAVGAAIATAVGVVIAFGGQTYFGVREVGFQPFPLSIAWILGLSLVVAGAGRGLFEALAPRLSETVAVAVTSVAALGVLGAGLFALMDESDRLELRRLLGMRSPGVPSGAP